MTTIYKTPESYKTMATHFAERLDLHAQGIGEISRHKDHYPLHRAVIENNLQLVHRILVGER